MESGEIERKMRIMEQYHKNIMGALEVICPVCGLRFGDHTNFKRDKNCFEAFRKEVFEE